MPARLHIACAISLTLCVAASPHPASACSTEHIALVIDETGLALRKQSLRNKSAIDNKVQALIRKKGWPKQTGQRQAWALLTDPKVNALDKQAADLLIELNNLGDESSRKSIPCEQRLHQAKTASKKLIATSKAKTKRLLARLDAELGTSSKASRATTTQAHRKPKTSAPARQPRQQPQTKPWSTQHVDIQRPSPAPGTTPNTTTRPPLDPTYSADEIAAAGRGFFGTLSSNLAAVIQHAINSYGRPSGYILGTEGSGAFIAGLRYGKGKLAMKTTKPVTVHWQGPSLGYDVGVTGSRVMFLVYNIRQPSAVFRRYIGIDGSAYVVGGAGITFLQRGKVIMAPIRTGVGLRIGANIGYLKFTEKPSLNPF